MSFQGGRRLYSVSGSFRPSDYTAEFECQAGHRFRMKAATSRRNLPRPSVTLMQRWIDSYWSKRNGGFCDRKMRCPECRKAQSTTEAK